MDDNGANRRKFKRIYFPQELVVVGTLIIPGEHEIDQQVKILNMSEGGLFFIYKKKEGGKIF